MQINNIEEFFEDLSEITGETHEITGKTHEITGETHRLMKWNELKLRYFRSLFRTIKTEFCPDSLD